MLSAACGLLAFAVLGVVRKVVARRYGASVVQTIDMRSHGRLMRRLLIETMATVVLVAGLVTIWYVWIESADISPIVVPRPSRVWSDLTGSPSVYVDAALATLTTALFAFIIGVAVGAIAAIMAARLPLFAGITVPVIVLMAATPVVALFPLFARLLGYSPSTVRVIAAAMVFFPVFVYTRSGLAAANRSVLDVVDAFGGRPAQAFWLVRLPSTVPAFVSGCRIAAGSAVIATVVGESLIGREGLGVEFSNAYRQLTSCHARSAQPSSSSSSPSRSSPPPAPSSGPSTLAGPDRCHPATAYPSPQQQEHRTNQGENQHAEPKDVPGPISTTHGRSHHPGTVAARRVRR